MGIEGGAGAGTEVRGGGAEVVKGEAPGTGAGRGEGADQEIGGGVAGVGTEAARGEAEAETDTGGAGAEIDERTEEDPVEVEMIEGETEAETGGWRPDLGLLQGEVEVLGDLFHPLEGWEMCTASFTSAT